MGLFHVFAHCSHAGVLALVSQMAWVMLVVWVMLVA